VAKQNGRIHNQVAELLSAYIDNEVTRAERALVETHVATCPECARDLTTLRQTVRLLTALPPLAVPRAFTLREADVKPLGPARRAWWRLPWAQGLVAATAVLLCVAAVGGILLLRQSGMVTAPAAAPEIAREAPIPTTHAAPAAGPEGDVEEEQAERERNGQVEQPAPPAAAEEALVAATEEATAELGLQQEAPAEPPTTAAEIAAQKAERAVAATPELFEAPAAAEDQALPAATPTEELMAGAAAQPSATAPGAAEGSTGTPSPDMESMTLDSTATLTPTLIEVQDLKLEIRPGVIRVSGRLPLPRDRQLLAELWRDGQPIDWATPESLQTRVMGNGRFSLELRAWPENPDANLLAAPPAYYEIRLHPVDPPEPVEARIYFDTYGPAPAAPTVSP